MISAIRYNTHDQRFEYCMLIARYYLVDFVATVFLLAYVSINSANYVS